MRGGPANACMLLAVAAIVGCSGESASEITQTVVIVDAQPCVRDAARGARVRVFGDDGAVVLDQSVSFVDGEDGATSLPLRIPIVPIDGDATRRFWVDVSFTGLPGSSLGVVRVAGSYLEGRLAAIPTCLVEGCRGVDCGVCAPPAPCSTCRADVGACASTVITPIPFENAESACGSGPSTCGADAGAATCDGGCDAGVSTPDGSVGDDAGVGDAGPPPPECTSDGDCDDADGCTTDVCASERCVHGAVDADGDGHAPTGCGGDDCNDGDPGVHPGVVDVCNGRDDNCSGVADEGVAESCGNGADDDCDGVVDCFDPDCAGACQQRQCNPGFPQFRWCGGSCVNTNQPSNCGGCGIVCRGTACRTDLGDGHPRCGCMTNDSPCPGTHCNTAARACACTDAASCGPNAHCSPGGGLPAYCDFNF